MKRIDWNETTRDGRKQLMKDNHKRSVDWMELIGGAKVALAYSSLFPIIEKIGYFNSTW